MVLVTSWKQPKAAFAPFLKFFTISFDAPPTVGAGERSRKRHRERAIFSYPSLCSSALSHPLFFLRSRGMYTGEEGGGGAELYPYST